MTRGLCRALAGALLLALVSAGSLAGELELRVTDHRPGIADFRWLEVAIAGLALHRKGAGRRAGWIELIEGASPIDIVPLKDGRWAPLGRAWVPSGDYDAVSVRFAHTAGELLTRLPVRILGDDSIVRFDLTVPPQGTQVIVLDLYAEDLSDHGPRDYAVRVKEIRLAVPTQNSRLPSGGPK